MKQNILLTSILGLLLVLSLTLFSYPYLVANWRECISAPGCSCLLQGTMLPLTPSITESAGCFLNSHSAYQAFLNRVEMADINGIEFNELKDILYNALDNMEKAKAAYANVKTAALKVPNDPVMIDKLMKFDYDSFQVNYDLIGPIFEKVKGFLIKGDVSGIDDAMLANMDNILRQLYEVKAALAKTQLPDIALLWQLNQSYTNAQLFGQYMSQIIKANL